MGYWTLGEVKLSQRVKLEVSINCGGDIEPKDLAEMGVLLQGIARAARKWRRGVTKVVPEPQPGAAGQE